MINTFWLVLGYACNNNCIHCYASPSVYKRKWMDYSFAKEVIITLKENGAKECLLIGGEPTLYPNLIEVISFGANNGLKMIIVSNGRRFSDPSFAQSLFSSGLDRAIISLESTDEEVHDSMTRREGSFRETVKGIRVCSQKKKVSTLTTICRSNSSQLVETVEFAYNLGVKRVVFNCAIPTISKNNIFIEECLDPADLARIVNSLFIRTRKLNLSFHLNATFPICLLDKDILKEMLDLGWITIGCHMYRGQGVVFDPEGNILPCTHFSDSPLITKDMCSKIKIDFLKIWNDPNGIPETFRRKLWRYPSKKCLNCEYWGGCVGGCPLLWTHFDPITIIK